MSRAASATANVQVVTDVSAVNGAEIARRRAALGMDIKQLAERAGVSRDTLSAVEHGSGARPSTLRAIVQTLEAIEREVSGPYDEPPPAPPPPRTVTYRVQGNFGIDVTVEGPVEDMAQLQASVVAILAQMQQQAGQ